MACSEEQQQTNFKHFCRICRKGFMCGRALGGHMRAHGIGDEGGNLNDEDSGSDWEDKVGGSDRNNNKRMYALRTNPNRLKSCRVCENCGKEFLSWKSFLEHGKCSSEAESLVSSPGSEYEDDGQRRGCGWSKRKRTFRAKVESYTSLYQYEEDEDLALAKCLMALSNAKAYPSDIEPEESCASASKDEERRNAVNSVTAFLAPLTRPFSHEKKAKGVAKGLFECKACKKVFNSHQALGGHRASHKKVKGCFAARGNQFDDPLGDDDVITHEEFFPPKATPSLPYEHGPSIPLVGASRRKSKVHECSICHRVFSSGQALGGHKRCHWLTSNSPEATSLIKYHHPFHDHHNTYQTLPPQHHQTDPLDLNLPAPTDVGMARIRRDPWNPLSFEVSTEINLQSWVDVDGEDKHRLQHHHFHHQQQHGQSDAGDDKVINTNKSMTDIMSMQNVEDEADSTLKLAKLSELKDMNINGSSSPWLQVGMGSITDGGAN